MQALLSKFYLQPDLNLVVPLPYEEHKWTIAQWTKADLLAHFSALADADTLNHFPVDANRLLLRHSPGVLRFLDSWCETAAIFHRISDDPSTIQEHPAFIEHWHDQAIFNLLLPRLHWTTGLEIILNATRLKQ